MDFEILETLALKDGLWQNWPLHRARLQTAAGHFGYPLDQAALEGRMQALQQQHAVGDWRVRLALDARGQVQIALVPLPPSAVPVWLELARQPIANSVAQGDFVRFKTSRRAHYDAFSPQSDKVFDVVLHNENGEITEGTRGNVCMRLDGRWVTPPLACGLLPGVGRALALARGRVTERMVRIDEVPRVEAWAFVNSLRGWLDAQLIGAQ
jgi:para-aminobenzoate synthetase/4-amino-4-deoxychorismate lyase